MLPQIVNALDVSSLRGKCVSAWKSVVLSINFLFGKKLSRDDIQNG